MEPRHDETATTRRRSLYARGRIAAVACALPALWVAGCGSGRTVAAGSGCAAAGDDIAAPATFVFRMPGIPAAMTGGRPAADFIYTASTGGKGRLRSIRIGYTPFCFHNPECDECARVKVSPEASPIALHLVSSGSMTVPTLCF